MKATILITLIALIIGISLVDCGDDDDDSIFSDDDDDGATVEDCEEFCVFNEECKWDLFSEERTYLEDEIEGCIEVVCTFDDEQTLEDLIASDRYQCYLRHHDCQEWWDCCH